MAKTKGLHERLNEIVQEISGINMETEFDGPFFLSAAMRDRVRRVAARMVELVDEYDRLDPLPRAKDEK